MPTSLTDASRLRASRGRAALLQAVAVVIGGTAVNLSFASGSGQIYRVDDDSSAIHLTDAPARDARNVVLLIAEKQKQPTRTDAASTRLRGRRAAVDDIVRNAARAQNLDAELLHAVIGVESSYRSASLSPKGALGLMQLMPQTARALGVTDPLDAEQNVNAGARQLRSLLDVFGQDKTLALAAYNAGIGAVHRHHDRIPPFAETMNYVPRVLASYSTLLQEAPAAAAP